MHSTAGTGVGSRITRHERRGGTKMRNEHAQHCPVANDRRAQHLKNLHLLLPADEACSVAQDSQGRGQDRQCQRRCRMHQSRLHLVHLRVHYQGTGRAFGGGHPACWRLDSHQPQQATTGPLHQKHIDHAHNPRHQKHQTFSGCRSALDVEYTSFFVDYVSVSQAVI